MSDNQIPVQNPSQTDTAPASTTTLILNYDTDFTVSKSRDCGWNYGPRFVVTNDNPSGVRPLSIKSRFGTCTNVTGSSGADGKPAKECTAGITIYGAYYPVGTYKFTVECDGIVKVVNMTLVP